MKSRYMMAVLVLLVLLASCNSEETIDDKTIDDKMTVAVSIVPQAAFVKAVAGDLVDIVTLIPPGASPANYQPSPREMADFSKAKIYFTVGVGAEETNILPNVATQNEGIDIVDLAKGVDGVYDARYFEDEEHHDEAEDIKEDDHDHDGRDPHIWMSPKRVVIMVEGIRDALIEVDPDNEGIYEENTENYISQLSTMNEALGQKFRNLSNRQFIVMHPSLGYFADDYDLEMIAVEEDGKEAGVKHLQKIIEEAKAHDIQVVFYQQEFDSSQAETIAKEINGEVQAYDPLSDNYIEMMYALADAFVEVLELK